MLTPLPHYLPPPKVFAKNSSDVCPCIMMYSPPIPALALALALVLVLTLILVGFRPCQTNPTYLLHLPTQHTCYNPYFPLSSHTLTTPKRHTSYSSETQSLEGVTGFRYAIIENQSTLEKSVHGY